ncbi:MAG: hypothetical protein RI580_07215 [Halothece sp. Uz-M2-17]|nr:hypothetical protein [Halothece sp. Uz-M2-17]
MTYSNDPKHDQDPDNLNKNIENQPEKGQEITHTSRSPINSDLSPENDAEAQRLIEEEKQVKKAQKITIARKITQSVSYLVAALEILLGLRFILLVTGANPNNLFASFIYTLSKPFAVPFSNLFGTIEFNGGTNIFDGNLLFGMLIYLLLMLLVNWLVQIIARP